MVCINVAKVVTYIIGLVYLLSACLKHPLPQHRFIFLSFFCFSAAQIDE